MWAMMPIFLNLLRSCLAIVLKGPKEPVGHMDLLPLIVRKRLVGVRHAVRVFLLLDRIPAVVCRIENLGRQTIRHRLFTAAACVGDDPPDCQGTAPFLVYFDRHLISRTADASRLHFNRRLHVIDRALENLQRLFAGLVANLPHGIVENALGHTLLAFPHHAADELRHQRAVVDRIGKYFASFGYSSSWHIVLVYPALPRSVLSLFSTRFGPFRSILRASLFAIGNADRIERAANHVIADAGKILHAAASNQDNR